jgi:site-specific DNA recombinase
MITVALYARVSSEKQAQLNTIASQIAALEERIKKDSYELIENYKYIDNGYSGSNLNRPALEKLRDKVADGAIDKIYIHSPDRLSRKYAYQMILLEEFQKGGAEIIFLNYQSNESPESHLLLQMQGMIAEYERAKIMERYRRGKIHAAKKGSVNVLGGAPYGYRYVDKNASGGQAFYEIQQEEAEIVQKVFFWIGYERLTIGEVCRRLKGMNVLSPKGKSYWDRSVIWLLLKNPAYKGQAAFGKTKSGPKMPRIRPQKHSNEQPKRNHSIYNVEKENWIYIPVPALIDECTFDIVQRQLEENRKAARTRRRGAAYLLQGLIVCQCCHYAYYGKPVRNKRGNKIDRYAYYRCIGSDAYRFGGERICNNKQIRTDALEIVVWEEVKCLLKNPTRIFNEYQNRIVEFEQSPLDQTKESLEKQENKLKRGMARLIDSYTEEHIEKEEFESRIKVMKQRLKLIETQKQEILKKENFQRELTLIVTNLKSFSANIESKLEIIDWNTKRNIIRVLVKRIEIEHDNVNIVFRVHELPDGANMCEKGDSQENLQHCNGRKRTTLRSSFVSGRRQSLFHYPRL